ncbi:MAG: HhH-GDP family DNA glycosylase [Planctomycetota bacterium]
MKNPRQSARTLSGLLRKLGKHREPLPLEDGDPITVMVMSFLMWDSTTARASAAYKRLMDRVVDYNDLRVSMPHELVEWVGPRYPLVLERCQRLRAALRHTYKREHAVNLDRLRDMGRREIKSYLRSLDGIAPYVADRVTLLCFDAHCVPVDTRLHRSLVRAGVGDETVEISEMASWLARQVKAAEAVITHRALQAWSDKVGSSTGRAAPARGTSKKKAKKTKATTTRKKR